MSLGNMLSNIRRNSWAVSTQQKQMIKREESPTKRKKKVTEEPEEHINPVWQQY